MIRFGVPALAIAIAFAAHGARAAPVGEMHRLTQEPTASLRDAEHRSDLRITVWYPAAPGAVEHEIELGPPGQPTFDAGSSAANAAFAPDGGKRPVILLSHGFGGTARIMAWFGTAMARDGYIVVAVDHPGNNGADKMTVAGAMLWWDRADDLRAALKAAAADPAVGPHMDISRVGAAGFSAGGFTALVAAGARVDRDHMIAFCRAKPDDGICRPQQEFTVTMQDFEDLFKRPEMQAEAARAGDDHSTPEVRAAFVMAPGLVQALSADGLAKMHTPVEIILGDADPVAPPATNGLAAAKAIPNATLIRLPGVGHYDFLATCTDRGRAVVPLCQDAVPQDETHQRAIEAARTFFAQQLGAGR